jgi:hypothetical protein
MRHLIMHKLACLTLQNILIYAAVLAHIVLHRNKFYDLPKASCGLGQQLSRNTRSESRGLLLHRHLPAS